jgi:hypothetical protein
MSNSVPSNSSNVQPSRPQYFQSKWSSSSGSNRSSLPDVANADVDSIEQRQQPRNVSDEIGNSIKTNDDEPLTKVAQQMHQHEDDWVTEVSWTDDIILQAAELEKQADAAYIAQMAALQRSSWTGHACGRGCSVTPAAQIQSSHFEEYETEKYGAFSGFSASNEVVAKKKSWQRDNVTNQDPFKTPASKRILTPRASSDLPPIRSLRNSSAKWIIRHRDPPLSPCAYRGRVEADLLFNELQREVITNGQPHSRNVLHSGSESKYHFRLSNTADLGQARSDMTLSYDIRRHPELDALLGEFDSKTTEILEHVKAANELSFIHAQALLKRNCVVGHDE